VKVHEVYSFALSIPLSSVPPSAWERQWSNQVYTTVVGDRGRGLGESLLAGGIPAETIEGLVNSFLSKVMVNRDVDPASANEILQKVGFSAGLQGIMPIAISGIDIALWDLAAKQAEQALSEMLGKPRRREIPVYASFPRYRGCEDLLMAVRGAVQKGFEMIKIHQAPADAAKCLKSIRENYPRLKVAVDLNCGLFTDVAAKELSRMYSYGVEWFEEPVWPPDDYQSLKELRDFPIAAGEDEYRPSGFAQLIDSEVKYLQPDVTKAGGVTGFLRARELSEKYGVPLAPHVRPHRSYVGESATLQLAAVFEEVKWVEFCPWGYPEEIFSGTPLLSSGRAVLSSEKGVGTTLRWLDYAYRGGYDRLGLIDV